MWHPWVLCAALLGWAGNFSARNSSAIACDFCCDLWDCLDRRDCGYHPGPAPLGAAWHCDFEGTFCNWEDVSLSGFRWLPVQGQDPAFDHTLGTDQGWYLRALGPQGGLAPSGGPARLRSPILRETAATCEIHGWYYSSQEVPEGTLTLELTHSGAGGPISVRLWQSPQASPGGATWLPLLAYPGQVEGPFQVTFSSEGHMALDDLSFRHCEPPSPQSCAGLTPTRFCDGTQDCANGSDEQGCDSYHSCSFEDDWCNWEAGRQSGLAWARNHSSQALGTSPTRDHTTNTPGGYFVHLVGSRPGWAELLSPLLTSNGSCHIVLYAHLRGSGPPRLNIYSQMHALRELVHSRTGDPGNIWFRQEAAFNITQDFQIVLEGILGTDPQSSVALDDLILSPDCIRKSGPLPAPPTQQPQTPTPCGGGLFACDEGHLCLATEKVCDFRQDCQDATDESQCGAGSDFGPGLAGWQDLSVGRVSWGSGEGLVLAEAPGQMHTPARAATPPLGPSGWACALKLRYKASPGGFLALAWAGKGQQQLWQSPANGTGAEWERVVVALGARERPFQLELLATGELSSKGFLAVGSVAFQDCDPNTSLAHPSGLSCNFEERHFCGWFPEPGNGFEWHHQAGRDHTTGQGCFLLVEPAAPRSRGPRARLVSAPQFPAVLGACLSFWYRLEGPQIGTFRLLAKSPGATEEEVLWTQTSSQGSVWRRAGATIPRGLPPGFQLAFDLLRDGFAGCAALDDIVLAPGPCAAPLRCNFEEPTACRTSGWARVQGTLGHGPSHDHTLGTPEGHYMLANKDPLRTGRHQALGGTHCVAFWYYLGGNGGALRAAVEEEGRHPVEVEALLAPGLKHWRYANFTAEVGQDWRVNFVAEGGLAALDDLEIIPGPCPGAGSCTFEHGTCGWRTPPGRWRSWDWTEGHYISFQPGARSATARLASETLSGTGCFQFRYRLSSLGADTELSVFLTGPGGERLLWRAANPQDGAWRDESLSIDSAVAEFEVVLEARTGAWPGTVAVDNIIYASGAKCEELRLGVVAPESYFGGATAAVLAAACTLLGGLLGWVGASTRCGKRAQGPEDAVVFCEDQVQIVDLA